MIQFATPFKPGKVEKPDSSEGSCQFACWEKEVMLQHTPRVLHHLHQIQDREVGAPSRTLVGIQTIASTTRIELVPFENKRTGRVVTSLIRSTTRLEVSGSSSLYPGSSNTVMIFRTQTSCDSYRTLSAGAMGSGGLARYGGYFKRKR
jgi:hypothetical protein